MVLIKFQVMKYPVRKTVKCRCGKTTVRRKTFECTVNPFNTNPDGSVKSPAEVREQAREKAMKWEVRPESYTCKTCQQQGGPQE